MMASFMSYFGARRDPKQATRDAIVGLRQQLQLLEKKEEYLQKKIEEELKKAKANAVTNKSGTFSLCIETKECRRADRCTTILCVPFNLVFGRRTYPP